MDSFVPWALVNAGLSSGWEAVKPYVTTPRGRVNLESVNPGLMDGTI